MKSLIEQLGLKVTSQHDNAVFIAENSQGQRFYWVDHPKGKALIAQQGAHIISYIPEGHPDILWVSQDSLYQAEKAIRGGVPVCWPWFGKRGEPSHGFARISLWQLADTQIDNDQAVLTFELNDSMIERSPFPFKVTYTLTIGKQLTLSLNSENTGSEAMPITGALHTYFAANRDQAQVTGLGEQYQDSLQGGKLCNEEAFNLDEATDRIYIQSGDSLLLSDGERQVQIDSQGQDSVVVWAVSPEQVDNMGDMHTGADKEYLCVEAAITQQPVMVEAGQCHLLEQKITAR